MGSSLPRRNVIDIGVNYLIIRVIQLHCDFKLNRAIFEVFGTKDIDRFRKKRKLVFIEVFDKRRKSPFIIKTDIVVLFTALVFKKDLHSLIEEGKFSQSFKQNIIFIHKDIKNLVIGPESHLGSPLCGGANFL